VQLLLAAVITAGRDAAGRSVRSCKYGVPTRRHHALRKGYQELLARKVAERAREQ